MPAGERPGALLSAKGRRPSHERTPISRYGGPAEDPVASRDLQTKQDNENKLIEDKESELTAKDEASRVLRGGSFNDRAGNLAWFKSAWFWVTVHTFYVPELGVERLQGEAGLIPRKAGVAEHLQPV